MRLLPTRIAPRSSGSHDTHLTSCPPAHAPQAHINKTNAQLAQEPKTKIAFDITNLRMMDDRHARNFSSLPAYVIEKMGPNVTNSGTLDPKLFTMAGYFQKETAQLGQRGFGYTIAIVPSSVQELLMSWNADPQWLEFKFIPDNSKNMYALTAKEPPADEETVTDKSKSDTNFWGHVWLGTNSAILEPSEIEGTPPPPATATPPPLLQPS